MPSSAPEPHQRPRFRSHRSKVGVWPQIVATATRAFATLRSPILASPATCVFAAFQRNSSWLPNQKQFRGQSLTVNVLDTDTRARNNRAWKLEGKVGIEVHVKTICLWAEVETRTFRGIIWKFMWKWNRLLQWSSVYPIRIAQCLVVYTTMLVTSRSVFFISLNCLLHVLYFCGLARNTRTSIRSQTTNSVQDGRGRKYLDNALFATGDGCITRWTSRWEIMLAEKRHAYY